MHEPFVTILTVAVAAGAILAELNLIRVFVADWVGHRREVRDCASKRRGRNPTIRRASPSPRTRRHCAACLIAPMLLTPIAHAQESAPSEETDASDKAPVPSDAPDAPQEETVSAFRFQANLDYTTAYFYHGIIQEDSGLILQPSARLTMNLYEQDDFKVDAYLATWNSFHGQKTGAQANDDFTDYWYEADLLGGVTFTLDKVSLSTQYVFLTSPSDAFETVQELNVILAYDDTDLLGAFALHPYSLLVFETGADSSDGTDSDTGIYLELGIAPGFSVGAAGTQIGISFPVSVGLSLDNYYENADGVSDTFGFVQVGAKASIPLPISTRYGNWTLNLGVAGLFLGDNTAEYNGGDDAEVIGTVGVQLHF